MGSVYVSLGTLFGQPESKPSEYFANNLNNLSQQMDSSNKKPDGWSDELWAAYQKRFVEWATVLLAQGLTQEQASMRALYLTNGEFDRGLITGIVAGGGGGDSTEHSTLAGALSGVLGDGVMSTSEQAAAAVGLGGHTWSKWVLPAAVGLLGIMVLKRAMG